MNPGVAGLAGPGRASVETDACHGKPAQAGWVVVGERALARLPWQTPDESGVAGSPGLAGQRLKPTPAGKPAKAGSADLGMPLLRTV